MRISIKMMLIGVAALLAAAPLPAQRQQSLAERVSSLEQQLQSSAAQRGQVNNELLEQLLQLRSEVQALRGAIEKLEHENEQLKHSSRIQYLDIDSRLNRLEGTDSPPRAEQGALSPLPNQTPQRPNGIVAGITATPAQAERTTTSASAATDERTAYNLAFQALKTGDYGQSAQLFLDFLQTHPNGTYAPNALYWLGESYYAAGDYSMAQTQFNALIQRYPAHDKAAGGLLKLALSQLSQGNMQQAEEILAQVTTRFPGSDAARTAQERLQTLNLSSAIR